RAPRCADANRSSLLKQSCLHPATEEFDAFFGPGSITRHRAALQPAQNFRRVLRNVGLLPQIEGEPHRLAIHLSKERLDMRAETDSFRQLRHPYLGCLAHWCECRHS